MDWQKIESLNNWDELKETAVADSVVKAFPAGAYVVIYAVMPSFRADVLKYRFGFLTQRNNFNSYYCIFF